MIKNVRIGIVGAGVFGNYHANKCAENPKIDFIGVYDIDSGASQDVAKKHDVVAFETYENMLGRVDAVIISCAAPYHGSMAVQALRAKRHCLIEKPLAASLYAAEEILALSQSEALIVQAGHQERFVARAIGLQNIPERPKTIKAFRMGTYSTRGTDVSVTLDLMTHDLDLTIWLMGEFPQEVSGETETVHSETADIARAHLSFTSGNAEITASRAADSFKRTMDIEYPSGTVHVDFNAKTLRHDTPFDLDANFGANPIAMDSLGAATESFVDSILNGGRAAITAQDGYDALRLALMIDEAAKRGA